MATYQNGNMEGTSSQ